jgi:Xaa-Pro aminopeptidase
MDALLISKPENIMYLSGFTGGSDAQLLLTLNNQFIFTDGRYVEQANRECPDWELLKVGPGLDRLLGVCDKFNRVGCESHYLSYDIFCQLQQRLREKLVSSPGLVEVNRRIKDEQELHLIKAAANIGDRVFAQICQTIRPGLSEKEVSDHIACLLRKEGCSKEAFDTIAVAGENSALPHGRPGERTLNPGDMVTMDFGGFYQGYAGDMTRTIVIVRLIPGLRIYTVNCWKPKSWEYLW